ncbi:MAG TPA: DUF1028 domain-containing protein [Symbiobacteriaceae bacterium]
MTFSIAAVDRKTGQIGIAVQSKAFAVGRAVPWAKPGVGAVCTQASTNAKLGPAGLDLLARGLTPQEAIDRLLQEDEGRKTRQLGIVDASGRAATYTGANCLPWAGGLTGDGWACQGNILTGPEVVEAMARAFTNATGPLAERLLAALKAGQEAGGDSRGMQSAALLVVSEDTDHPEGKLIDLRVDDHDSPIEELERLYQVYRRWTDHWQGEWIKYQGDVVLMAEQVMQMRGIPSLKALADALGVRNAIQGSRISQEFFQAILRERQK